MITSPSILVTESMPLHIDTFHLSPILAGLVYKLSHWKKENRKDERRSKPMPDLNHITPTYRKLRLREWLYTVKFRPPRLIRSCTKATILPRKIKQHRPGLKPPPRAWLEHHEIDALDCSTTTARYLLLGVIYNNMAITWGRSLGTRTGEIWSRGSQVEIACSNI